LTLNVGFSHLVVEVTDLDRSEKFYQDVFGMDLLGRDLVADDRPNSLLAMNTRQRILLVKVDKVQPFRPNSSSIHHGWYVTTDQFDRAEQRLAAMGFNITDSRKAFRATGERSLDVFDPDGHRYQIQCYGKESKEVMPAEDLTEVVCGNVRDFAVGSVKTFAKERFFLVRLEGGFHALSRWCTHMNGTLRWQQEHWQFYCPMHGVTFDRRGMCTAALRYAPPLRAHPVHIAEDGTITVRPDIVIEREAFDPNTLTAPARETADQH
jgi:catechol 2,3-dioxygenase-like lactoylglutathione lyase family enzyme/nitrite reductase/ring-hydroxylating ferredoxin subunit